MNTKTAKVLLESLLLLIAFFFFGCLEVAEDWPMVLLSSLISIGSLSALCYMVYRHHSPKC